MRSSTPSPILAHSLVLTGLLFLFTSLSGCTFLTPAPQPATEAPASPKPNLPPNQVQLTPQAILNADIQTIQVKRLPVRAEIMSMGKIQPDENRIYHVSAPLPGTISHTYAPLGIRVQAGQTVATLKNLDIAKIYGDYIHELHQNEVDIARAKAELDLAKKNLDREKRLLQQGITPRRDYDVAYSNMVLAQTKLNGYQEHATHLRSETAAYLSVYGMKLGSSKSHFIQNTVPLKAPQSGIITQKNVTTGDNVTAEQMLYEISDLRLVWLDITLYPQDVDRVSLGQAVQFKSDAIRGHLFQGKINYLKPIALQDSQTFVARVFLENPHYLLKPGMLGEATISLGESAPMPYVPEAAIQRVGNNAFVFVDRGQGRYEKRDISLGAPLPGGYSVKSGLSAQEPIVTEGSFILKSELFKNQMLETH